MYLFQINLLFILKLNVMLMHLRGQPDSATRGTAQTKKEKFYIREGILDYL